MVAVGFWIDWKQNGIKNKKDNANKEN